VPLHISTQGIREPWNNDRGHSDPCKILVSIRRADQGALERRVTQATPPGHVSVSIRRADQGALERAGFGCGQLADRRFNPPGGSGSLGTTAVAYVALTKPCFNPPGGSGSLGTCPRCGGEARASKVSIRRADQGALELRAWLLAAAVGWSVSIRRADQGALELRLRQPLQSRYGGFNPPGGSGSLGTLVSSTLGSATRAVSIRRADQGALEPPPR